MLFSFYGIVCLTVSPFSSRYGRYHNIVTDWPEHAPASRDAELCTAVQNLVVIPSEKGTPDAESHDR
jgi:hypothetical protein